MNFWLSALIGVSFGTWLYAKVLRRRMVDTKGPMIASVSAALLLTAIIYAIASILIPE